MYTTGACNKDGVCFVAGTLVYLANETSIPIEQVKVGAVVELSEGTWQALPDAYREAQRPDALLEHVIKMSLEDESTGTHYHLFGTPETVVALARSGAREVLRQVSVGMRISLGEGRVVVVRSVEVLGVRHERGEDARAAAK